MDQDRMEIFNEFDNSFEDALGELFDAGITADEIKEYFGPMILGAYILERFNALAAELAE